MSAPWPCRLLPLLLVLLLPAPAAAGPRPLYDRLTTLKFLHEGVARAADTYEYRDMCVRYTEGLDTWNNLVPPPPDRHDHGSSWRRYLFGPNATAPPPGLRSAVPLGGLGTGSFELRGDGGIHEWLVENNGPGLWAGTGTTKAQRKDVRLAAAARPVRPGAAPGAAVLQTQPPEGLPGVEGLVYSGAYPVSRLKVQQEAMPVELQVCLPPWHRVSGCGIAVGIAPSPSPPPPRMAEWLCLCHGGVCELSIRCSWPPNGRMGPAQASAPDRR